MIPPPCPVSASPAISFFMPPQDDPFANAIWNALHSTHQHLALTHNLALKYPADIAPFACLAENTTAALLNLHTLLAPNETTYILGDPPPSTDALLYRGFIPCLQMAFPQDSPPSNPPSPSPL
jgi:hypothetical protein